MQSGDEPLTGAPEALPVVGVGVSELGHSCRA